MTYIIIGASAAGITAAKMLRKKEPHAVIRVFSKEREIHSRCMLHKFVEGERNEETLSFVEPDFFVKNNIEWIRGVEVTSVEVACKTIKVSNGKSYAYDKLLIATGAKYFIPPIKDLKTAGNVFGLRDLSDAKMIKASLPKAKKAVVIGGGLVGMDIASGFIDSGIDTTVIEMTDKILALQLDDTSARAYQSRFEDRGCKFYLDVKVEAGKVDGNGEIAGVVLSNGEVVPCDIAVVAAGVRNNMDCIENTNIKRERGICVNPYMQTSDADIYAAGDVTGLAGIWPNAMKQGEIAARNMVGENVVYEDTFAIKNTIHFYGLATLSLGRIAMNADDVVYIREDKDIYQKIIVHNHQVVGVIIQGDLSHVGVWQYLIKNKINISEFEERIFDISFADFYTIDTKTGKYFWSV